MVATLLQLLFDELVGLLSAEDIDDSEDTDETESRLSNEEAQLASAEVVGFVAGWLESRCWHL
jgi:hypothetical protein